MTEQALPIIWEKRAGNRLVGKLGVVEVAQVNPWVSVKGIDDACWRVFLPGFLARPESAPTLMVGKQRAEAAIMAWIDAAGLAPATARELALRGWRSGNAAPGGELATGAPAGDVV